MEAPTHQQMNEVLRALRKLVLAVESGTAVGFDEDSRELLATAVSEASVVTSNYRTAVSFGEHRLVFECPEDAAEFTLLSLQIKSKPDEWRAAAAKAVNLDEALRLELQQDEISR